MAVNLAYPRKALLLLLGTMLNPLTGSIPVVAILIAPSFAASSVSPVSFRAHVTKQLSIGVLQAQGTKNPSYDLPPDARSATLRRSLTVEPATVPYDLTRISGMTVDSAGRMYVLDGTDQRIRVFDASGRELRLLGRRGEGPGEFQMASALTVVRDTLWVVDLQTEMITGFSLRSWGPRAFKVPGTGVGLKRIQSVISGGFLASAPPSAAPSPFAKAPAAAAGEGGAMVVRLNQQGSVLNTVVSNLSPGRSLTYTAAPAGQSSNSWRSFTRQPFAHYEGVTTSEGGTSVIHISTVKANGRETGQLRLSRIATTGQTKWTKALSFRARTLTSADVRHVVDSISQAVTMVRGARLVANRQMLEDSIARPAIWPPVDQLLSGLDGTIWLKQFGTDRFWVLSPSGVYETTVVVPKGFKVTAATRSQVWGWRLDVDDMPVVERYDVVRQ